MDIDPEKILGLHVMIKLKGHVRHVTPDVTPNNTSDNNNNVELTMPIKRVLFKQMSGSESILR